MCFAAPDGVASPSLRSSRAWFGGVAVGTGVEDAVGGVGGVWALGGGGAMIRVLRHRRCLGFLGAREVSVAFLLPELKHRSFNSGKVEAL